MHKRTRVVEERVGRDIGERECSEERKTQKGTTKRKKSGYHRSRRIRTNNVGKVPDPVFAPWATVAVSQALGDIKSLYLYLLSDSHTSSALMMNVGSTHPESAQGVGENTRCRVLVVPASYSLAGAEVAEQKQRSVR